MQGHFKLLRQCQILPATKLWPWIHLNVAVDDSKDQTTDHLLYMSTNCLVQEITAHYLGDLCLIVPIQNGKSQVRKWWVCFWLINFPFIGDRIWRCCSGSGTFPDGDLWIKTREKHRIEILIFWMIQNSNSPERLFKHPRSGSLTGNHLRTRL